MKSIFLISNICKWARNLQLSNRTTISPLFSSRQIIIRSGKDSLWQDQILDWGQISPLPPNPPPPSWKSRRSWKIASRPCTSSRAWEVLHTVVLEALHSRLRPYTLCAVHNLRPCLQLIHKSSPHHTHKTKSSIVSLTFAALVALQVCCHSLSLSPAMSQPLNCAYFTSCCAKRSSFMCNSTILINCDWLIVGHLKKSLVQSVSWSFGPVCLQNPEAGTSQLLRNRLEAREEIARRRVFPLGENNTTKYF